MAKRYSRQRRQRRTRRRTRKMRGGAFSQNEFQQLQNQGFTEYQIQSLTDLGVSFNEVMQKVNTIMNQGENGYHGNSDDLTEQVMIELLNEHIFENPNANDMIPHADDDIHNIDDNDLDMSMDQSQGTLHLSDLNTTDDSMDTNTTVPDESLNFSQISDISMPSMSENESFVSEIGGKKRRRKTSRKTKKTKKTRKQRKQKGGMCYGNGVGANSYDPNFSIYNTRQLQLFPYKP